MSNGFVISDDDSTSIKFADTGKPQRATPTKIDFPNIDAETLADMGSWCVKLEIDHVRFVIEKKDGELYVSRDSRNRTSNSTETQMAAMGAGVLCSVAAARRYCLRFPGPHTPESIKIACPDTRYMSDGLVCEWIINRPDEEMDQEASRRMAVAFIRYLKEACKDLAPWADAAEKIVNSALAPHTQSTNIPEDKRETPTEKETDKIRKPIDVIELHGKYQAGNLQTVNGPQALAILSLSSDTSLDDYEEEGKIERVIRPADRKAWSEYNKEKQKNPSAKRPRLPRIYKSVDVFKLCKVILQK